MQLVWCEGDYKRPATQKGQAWQSKVQWDLRDQYDTRGLSNRSTRVAGADEEARQNMEREAAFNKYYSKVVESRSSRE